MAPSPQPNPSPNSAQPKWSKATKSAIGAHLVSTLWSILAIPEFPALSQVIVKKSIITN